MRKLRFPALWLVFTALPAAPQAPGVDKVVGGPYAVNVGPHSATVMWLVQSGEGTVLRPQRLELTGLNAGTTYNYQAFPGDAGKGSFKTALTEPGKFQFAVYGDTRTRHDVHRKVISALLQHANPDFVLHTGDLVADGNDTSLWPIFFDAERDLLRKTAFFPALGNHERNARNYADFASSKAFYSFNWGSAHFTVINSDIENAAATKVEREAFWSAQTHWLEDDLRESQSAAFRFLVAHHPPMTAVESRQGDNKQMTALEPMFQKYKVSAGFFGHDHNYQHYLKSGVHYFITGGGGAPLYNVKTPPAGITKKVQSIENFVVVDVDGTKARIEAMAPNGEAIDITNLGQ